MAQETWRHSAFRRGGWQTGFNPVIAMELLATGEWAGSGVLGPEAFEAGDYLTLLDKYGIHQRDGRNGARR